MAAEQVRVHERREDARDKVRRQLEWPEEAEEEQPPPDSHAPNKHCGRHVARLRKIPRMVLHRKHRLAIRRTHAVADKHR